ncbi:MAG: hypothetical protein A3H97_11300 [Acidobacteria bacterium RIFCSPLOWO2_02_FULL_65_29]|nr:MAG: hypothetical protein A3H97_11300 [Acidobacteria bacterium RIFCSPLOWO2_02_FULL_65_29]
MERVTKLLVIGSACAFVALKVALLSYGWPRLLPMSAGAFVCGAVLATVDRRAIRLVLVFLYVFPALIALLHGPYHVDYDVLWLSALLGVLAPDAFRTPWHLPARWRAPLVLWALVTAVGTLIVFGREMDFYPALLDERGVLNSASGGGGPSFVIRWILHVGLIPLVGILWFDWLFGATASLDFHKNVAMPLLVSCLVLAAVSMYQLFVDFSFLNANVFGGTGRASGTMFDANASGVTAAFWTGGAVLWASGLRRWRTPLFALAFSAAWLAVWASGSRNAFLFALVSSAFAILAFRGTFVRLARKVGPAQMAAVLALAIGLVWLASNVNPEIVGPLARVRATLPEASMASVRSFAWRMWDRDRYGSTALSMIGAFPAFGVGIGGYHLMLGDFLADKRPLPPDNAQNWFRHQLVEFGVVGSLGWLAWVVGFAWFVLSPRPDAPPAARLARGVLIGFVLISLVGMPAQVLAVSITFWTMAFWFVLLVEKPKPAAEAALPLRAWALVAAVVIAYTAGTVDLANSRLRVPVRAQHAGWPFSYGFYYPEPDGSGGEVRWARRRAAIVLDAKGPLIEIAVSVNHRDIASHPVDVKVWSDGRLEMNTRLTDATWQTLRVRVRERRVLLETRVSRVVRPIDFGVDDGRELGLLVKWRFFDPSP